MVILPLLRTEAEVSRDTLNGVMGSEISDEPLEISFKLVRISVRELKHQLSASFAWRQFPLTRPFLSRGWGHRAIFVVKALLTVSNSRRLIVNYLEKALFKAGRSTALWRLGRPSHIVFNQARAQASPWLISQRSHSRTWFLSSSFASWMNWSGFLLCGQHLGEYTICSCPVECVWQNQPAIPVFSKAYKTSNTWQ